MRFVYRCLALALITGLAVGSAKAAVPTSEGAPEALADRVREAIRELPYYGVFDLISLQVDDRGAVVLGGYVYEPSLKKSAEKAVKRVEGVTQVTNRIEALPARAGDDEIRWEVYWTIYRRSPLAHYGSSLGMGLGWRPLYRPWGLGFRHWDGFRGPFWMREPFWGMEPLGSYAIHIIVRRGTVTLAGVVDDQADKDLAGQLAKRVFGVRSVQNDLEVAPPAQ
jgi:osmotically-inducible protein OsmY